MPILGVSLAPGDGVKVADPTWERIDTLYNVQGWTIDRGRPNEMSRTDTGTASVEIVDRDGGFDPTNPSGYFYGLLTPGQPMGPLVQAGIALQNPTTGVWSTLFRGYISSIQWTPYQTEQHANVTLDLVDGFALLAACEMVPDGSFGHDFVDGNIVFNSDTSTAAVQHRINLVLNQAGWPATLRNIFTGNVQLQKTPYAPRSSVLSVIQDAADAEFPDIANVWIGGPRKPGMVVFHGRYARFRPDIAEYEIHTWQLGDDAANAAAPLNDVVRISPPLTASLDDSLLYTSAIATPQNIAPGDIEAQYVTDATAADVKGLRTWSAENLCTLAGATGTEVEEAKLFANYVVDNFTIPRVRVGQLTVKSRRPNTVSGQESWKLLCGVDLSDIVHLKTTHAGGGGFDTDFYVEGIHYVARPGGELPYVELTLDVSPRGYYDADPFPPLP